MKLVSSHGFSPFLRFSFSLPFFVIIVPLISLINPNFPPPSISCWFQILGERLTFKLLHAKGAPHSRLQSKWSNCSVRGQSLAISPKMSSSLAVRCLPSPSLTQQRRRIIQVLLQLVVQTSESLFNYFSEFLILKVIFEFWTKNERFSSIQKPLDQKLNLFSNPNGWWYCSKFLSMPLTFPGPFCSCTASLPCSQRTPWLPRACPYFWTRMDACAHYRCGARSACRRRALRCRTRSDAGVATRVGGGTGGRKRPEAEEERRKTLPNEYRGRGGGEEEDETDECNNNIPDGRRGRDDEERRKMLTDRDGRGGRAAEDSSGWRRKRKKNGGRLFRKIDGR